MADELEIIKKPYQKEVFTPDQELEIFKCSEDPIYFIEKYIKIQHPIKGRVPFKMYPFQKRMVDAFHKHKDVVSLCARQMGKCVSFDTYIKVNDTQKKIGKLINLTLKEKIVNILERTLIKLSS